MDITENHDDHTYGWVMFDRTTIAFVIRAFDFYLSLLADEDKELSNDSDLALLVTEETRREIGFGRDKERTKRIRQWLQEEFDKKEDSYDLSITLSHWLLRFMKSISLLYLARLKNKRNVLASKTNVTATTLAAVDREITAKEELFRSAGVFKNASTIQLLAQEEIFLNDEFHKSDPVEESLLSASRPRPVLVGTIEILDHELRTRCLDLFNQFQESGQSERNDTIVSEASRILENRLRLVTNCADGSNAKQLITLAFNGDNPRLKVSKVRAEQEAVQLLFLGTFGFIRNQVQHKLLGSVPAERVLQILGWVDYLLSVINQAEQVVQKP